MYYHIGNEYVKGVDDYYNGVVPEHWDNEEVRERSPYLTAWYQVSMADNYGDSWVITEEALDELVIDEDGNIEGDEF